MFTNEAPYLDCPHDRHRRIPSRDSPPISPADPAIADAAIEEIIGEDRLRSLVHRIAGQEADADNIVGSALFKLVERVQKQGIAPAEAKGWVNRVVRNEAIDLMRRSQRQTQAPVKLRQLRIITPPITDPARLSEGREVTDLIMASIDGLPELLRSIVLEHYFDGRSIPKVAARLGLKQSTAFKRHKEALELLRASLSPAFKDSAPCR